MATRSTPRNDAIAGDARGAVEAGEESLGPTDCTKCTKEQDRATVEGSPDEIPAEKMLPPDRAPAMAEQIVDMVRSALEALERGDRRGGQALLSAAVRVLDDEQQ